MQHFDGLWAEFEFRYIVQILVCWDKNAQERAALIRVCNSVNLKLVRILPPILKIVTHTA